MLTDTSVIGILIAHLGAFGSGELKSYMVCFMKYIFVTILDELM